MVLYYIQSLVHSSIGFGIGVVLFCFLFFFFGFVFFVFCFLFFITQFSTTSNLYNKANYCEYCQWIKHRNENLKLEVIGWPMGVGIGVVLFFVFFLTFGYLCVHVWPWYLSTSGQHAKPTMVRSTSRTQEGIIRP